MTLSRTQLTDRERFMRHLWIWERDMLELARRYPAWRDLAHELGFMDAKIDAPWTHADLGRQIKYADLPLTTNPQ